MNFIELLNIPKQALHKQRIPVKSIIDNNDLISQDKKLVEKSISSLYLIAVIDNNSANIASYKDEEHLYDSILVLEVTLKPTGNIEKLNEILHKVFPNPDIICYNDNNSNYMSLALKRRNKVEHDRVVIEDIVISEELNSIDEHKDIFNLTTFKVDNLKCLYETLYYELYKTKFIKTLGFYPGVNNEELKDLSKKLDDIKHKISSLDNEYRKASMLSEKMKVAMKIKKLEEERNRLVELLEDSKL